MIFLNFTRKPFLNVNFTYLSGTNCIPMPLLNLFPVLCKPSKSSSFLRYNLNHPYSIRGLFFTSSFISMVSIFKFYGGIRAVQKKEKEKVNLLGISFVNIQIISLVHAFSSDVSMVPFHIECLELFESLHEIYDQKLFCNQPKLYLDFSVWIDNSLWLSCS